MKKWALVLGVAALAAAMPLAAASGAADASAPAAQTVSPQVVEAVKSLRPTQGKVPIAAANATFDLGSAYDFYGPEDARTILVQVWGNPPESAANVLGVVMPAGASPLSDSWGAVVTYEDSGYVSDDDAADVDYADLLQQMQDGEAERNEQRKSQGYPAIHLAGWAEEPKYDAATHSVVWAQDLSFDDTPVHTLNYDVRTLGRKGVLSINFIASMEALSSIRNAAKAFTTHASFDPGARYADFDASTDRQAEYGVGGLIAAGVGLGVAKKLGIFAILLKFLKPLLIAAVAGFALLRNRIGGLFGRKAEEEADWSWDEPAAAAPEPAAAYPDGPGERGDLSGGDRA